MKWTDSNKLVSAEQTFQREQREAFERRVVRAAVTNPDLSMEMLNERFGTRVDRILGKHGVKRTNTEITSKDAARAMAPDFRELVPARRGRR